MISISIAILLIMLDMATIFHCHCCRGQNMGKLNTVQIKGNIRRRKLSWIGRKWGFSYITGARDVWHLLHRFGEARGHLWAEFRTNWVGAARPKFSGENFHGAWVTKHESFVAIQQWCMGSLVPLLCCGSQVPAAAGTSCSWHPCTSAILLCVCKVTLVILKVIRTPLNH